MGCAEYGTKVVVVDARQKAAPYTKDAGIQHVQEAVYSTGANATMILSAAVCRDAILERRTRDLR